MLEKDNKSLLIETLNEILPDNNGKRLREINEDDILLFSQCFIELKKIAYLYNQMTINRQVLGEYLTNYYIYLETFVEELLKNIQKEVLLYKPLGMLMVKDYYKIVRILLNSTDRVYLKIIYIENKNYLEKVYLILNNNQSWYITKDIFKPEEIPKLMAKLQEMHNSFVVASPYCLNNAIFPSHKWQINGLNGIILCYGGDDELSQIIESFLTFASSNGNRIDDIKEEQIIRAIRLKD